MVDDRRKIAATLRDLKDIMDHYYFPSPRDEFTKLYDFKKGIWTEESLIVKILQNKRFFSRYTRHEILKKILPFMKLKVYDKDEIIFTDNVEIVVILSGSVIIQSHSERAFPANIIATFSDGDILGSDKDSGITLDPQNWCIIQ
jgi:hypothetical protein